MDEHDQDERAPEPDDAEVATNAYQHFWPAPLSDADRPSSLLPTSPPSTPPPLSTPPPRTAFPPPPPRPPPGGAPPTRRVPLAVRIVGAILLFVVVSAGVDALLDSRRSTEREPDSNGAPASTPRGSPLLSADELAGALLDMSAAPSGSAPANVTFLPPYDSSCPGLDHRARARAAGARAADFQFSFGAVLYFEELYEFSSTDAAVDFVAASRAAWGDCPVWKANVTGSEFVGRQDPAASFPVAGADDVVQIKSRVDKAPDEKIGAFSYLHEFSFIRVDNYVIVFSDHLSPRDDGTVARLADDAVAKLHTAVGRAVSSARQQH